MASSRKAPKKSASSPKATKKAPAKKKEVAPAPETPVEEPSFVRQASPAERKAAMEAVLKEHALDEVLPTAAPTPAPDPTFVREKSPEERKAAVEQLVEESGVAGVLAKAPWKRRETAPAVPAAPAASPTAPGEVPERRSPKISMTTAPIEQPVGRSAPRVVILDTNALMMQFQFHVDIEREVRRILDFNFEIVVPTIVVKELERLGKEGNPKEQGEARMAAELAKTFRVEESPGDGDTGILRLAEKLNAVVVTNDKVLRARLRAKDLPNIYMRSRAFLTVDGHIPGL